MTDEPARRDVPRRATTRSRQFKPHDIELAAGGRLVLATDGSIRHLDDHGSTMRSWSLEDPEWPDQAIRFGLHPQTPTVTPQGRVEGTKPPRR